MQIESSNNSKDDAFPQSLKIEKENIICRTAFVHYQIKIKIKT